MAVDGIANLVQNLAHQIFRQRRETQAETHTLETGHAGNKAEDEDIFTSSAQNHSAQATAQDAGLFQVSQVALTEVTANVLFGLSTAGANQHGPQIAFVVIHFVIVDLDFRTESQPECGQLKESLPAPCRDVYQQQPRTSEQAPRRLEDKLRLSQVF